MEGGRQSADNPNLGHENRTNRRRQPTTRGRDSKRPTRQREPNEPRTNKRQKRQTDERHENGPKGRRTASALGSLPKHARNGGCNAPSWYATRRRVVSNLKKTQEPESGSGREKTEQSQEAQGSRLEAFRSLHEIQEWAEEAQSEGFCATNLQLGTAP